MCHEHHEAHILPIKQLHAMHAAGHDTWLPACRCSMDTQHQRYSTADYAFKAAVAELVMMELERDAWKSPWQPDAAPSLTPRCLPGPASAAALLGSCCEGRSPARSKAADLVSQGCTASAHHHHEHWHIEMH